MSEPLKKCSGSTIGKHKWYYVGRFEEESIYKCYNCEKLKKGRAEKTYYERKK